MRDHQGIVIEEFNGLWKRGDADSTPPDHFSECNNISFIAGGYKTRDGINTYLPYANVKRIYTFIQETGQSILVLDVNGNIFDSGSPTPYTSILSITGMTDFAFISINGRAYITPNDGHTGLENQAVWVYKGDGSLARKAAGVGPKDADGLLAAANNGLAGSVEAGVHIFAVVYETDTGFQTGFGPQTLPSVTAPGGQGVDLTNIPVSPNSYVTKVHIVATRAIDPTFYNGNTTGYQFFFVPGATVNNGVTTFTVSFFDSELLEDASHLQDLYEEIPAGVNINTYHSRMVVIATFKDISLALVSFPGEPEAISQIDGLIVAPLDGNPLTNCQEFRDVLYLFKQIRTIAYTDSGDVPSSWPQTILDQGIGASIHGIASVLDSGGVNVDFLIIVDYSGVMQFNGTYQRPELSWKIADFWLALNRNFFDFIQIVNDSLAQLIYMTLPDGKMLLGDYSNGLNAKDIRWSPLSFDIQTSTIALAETNKLIIGSLGILTL